VSDKKVIKRDGRVVDFDQQRIEKAIRKSMLSIGKADEDKLRKVMKGVQKAIDAIYSEDKTPSVEQIQDIVELELMKQDLFNVAKSYILYRKERERIRDEKRAILKKEYLDEVDKAFSTNALRLLATRYLLKDANGNFTEGPKQLLQRVAALVVIPDILHDDLIFDRDAKQTRKESEAFDPSSMKDQIGLRGPNGEFAFVWNEHHLERMRVLYEELNELGQAKISWSEFWQRIVSGEFDRYLRAYNEYYQSMVQKKFMPNSPTLFNAGAKLGQLSACFVLDIEDNIESIMKAAKDAAVIFKSGGGIGINYSKLRPAGEAVLTTSGVASGPVSFMKIIDVVTDVVKQGGKRRGANMGILNVDHPDIERFISCKSGGGQFQNFNISVMLTDKFWDCYDRNEPLPLMNPRTGQVWDKTNARKLIDIISKFAWETGDPGVVLFDNINRRNTLKDCLGPIWSTNPCGEEPLYPYESCNLGSIDLHAFVETEGEKVRFDWEELAKTILIALRFLDNVLDINKFPLPEIEEHTKATRKVGLGVMGLANTLFALGMPYNSEESFYFMNRVAEFLTYWSMWESANLSKERGAFPLYAKSSYPMGEFPAEGYYHRDEWTQDWDKLAGKIKVDGIRNAEMSTIAPTGSISMILDTSAGIEPQFALVYEKRVTAGTFFYTDGELERQLKESGLYSEMVLKQISDNGGSLQGLEGIPDKMREVYQTALDIPWWDHVRAQSCFARWVAAATSKTINMPSWAKQEDVLYSYLFAHKLGIKGITIYREGSLPTQVLVTPSSRKGQYYTLVKNRTLEVMIQLLGITPSQSGTASKPQPTTKILTEAGNKGNHNNSIFDKCPSCGSSRLVFESGCKCCLDCGWSYCPVA